MKHLRIFSNPSDMYYAVEESKEGIVGLAYEEGNPEILVKDRVRTDLIYVATNEGWEDHEYTYPYSEEVLALTVSGFLARIKEDHPEAYTEYIPDRFDINGNGVDDWSKTLSGCGVNGGDRLYYHTNIE